MQHIALLNLKWNINITYINLKCDKLLLMFISNTFFIFVYN